ncbi:uncharacterized protein BDV17DRAFT_41431 [Aspergillus undulatus]|uniref:uncharacterized protein n=1 Tax=Aspergillus undulatus TaxID=1810928 RepID=UPI003CCCD01C
MRRVGGWDSDGHTCMLAFTCHNYFCVQLSFWSSETFFFVCVDWRNIGDGEERKDNMDSFFAVREIQTMLGKSRCTASPPRQCRTMNIFLLQSPQEHQNVLGQQGWQWRLDSSREAGAKISVVKNQQIIKVAMQDSLSSLCHTLYASVLGVAAGFVTESKILGVILGNYPFPWWD